MKKAKRKPTHKLALDIPDWCDVVYVAEKDESRVIEWHFLPGDPPPISKKPNGRYDTWPVIIATWGDRVCGAYTDIVEVDGVLVTRFTTDEGIGYTNVVAWARMPKYPRPT